MKIEIKIIYWEWIRHPHSKIQQAVAERYVRDIDESDSDAFLEITKEAEEKKKEWEARLIKIRSDDFPFIQIQINKVE